MDEEIPTDSGESPAEPGAESRASADARGAENAAEETQSDVGEPPDDGFEEQWESLTDRQKRVAVEYAKTATKADAARAVGLHKDTVYEWPEKVWEVSNRIVERNRDTLEDAHAALVPEIIKIEERALDPDSDVSRVSAEMAQYLVDRLLGKPTRKSEVEIEGGIDLSDGDEEAIESALDGFGGE